MATLTFEPDPPGLGGTDGDFLSLDYTNDYLIDTGNGLMIEADPPLAVVVD